MPGEFQREQIRIVAENRKARHDYFIDETYEAGISLVGTEVKSLRAGKVNLRDSYADVANDEVFIHNMHISPYDKGNRFNHDPKRTRKLLLHRQEIKRVLGQTTQKGFTLIPLRIYFKGARAKVEVALARGKRLYDKREELARRDADREIARELRSRGHD